jgi:hypothetical protein
MHLTVNPPSFQTRIDAMSSALLGRSIRMRPLLAIRLLVIVLCCLNGPDSQAQTRSLPSHGKIKLDSYNYLLRDVHPASQAQANYLQNRLFLVGLKKAERLERRERLDAYGERQLIKELEYYRNITRVLGAGRPISAKSLKTFWILVSVFGDHPEVYDALTLEVPAMSHDDFTATSHYVRVLAPNGELAALPTLLNGSAKLDPAHLRLAWRIVVKDLKSSGGVTAPNAASFRHAVANFHRQCLPEIEAAPSHGRFEPQTYLRSIVALADALYRPAQLAQIRQYVERSGSACQADNMLGLITHMLQNRLVPAQGSTAQLALAEVARPLDRVLAQEIALRYERIDSLAANEGHRPYAAEYQVPADQASALPNRSLTSWTP